MFSEAVLREHLGSCSNQQVDTFSFSLDGYQTERLVVNADNYVSVKLKLLPANASSSKEG